jgi:hypothetical protein
MTNPFSKDYVPKIAIDHKDRKYRRPVVNQPSVDVHQTLNTNFNKPTITENYRRISKTKI